MNVDETERATAHPTSSRLWAAIVVRVGIACCSEMWIEVQANVEDDVYRSLDEDVYVEAVIDTTDGAGKGIR